MNEIAQLCERLGADVDMVRKGMGSDDKNWKKIFISRDRLWWKLFSKRCTGIGKISTTGQL